MPQAQRKRIDSADEAIEAVIWAGAGAAARGWVPATSGNFSARIDQRRIAITRTGVDKGALTHTDILIQDLAEPLANGASAETGLHVAIYKRQPSVNAVSHIHGHYSTIIGQAHVDEGVVRVSGWELQKAITGIKSHTEVVEVPVFANDQDITALSEQVSELLASSPTRGHFRAPAFLLAGHGLYAWGDSPRSAARHVEALEVLLQQIVTFRSYQA